MSLRNDQHAHCRLKRMGYWISEKKSKKLLIEDFTDFCRNRGIQLIKLDLDRPIEDQGPFDLIFHKLTDVLAKINSGNERARDQIQRFQQFIAAHPEVVIVDPLDNLFKLMDRHQQYQFVTGCEVVEKAYHFFTPSFVEFTSMDVEMNKSLMERYGVQFPFICKPSIAHGSTRCHQMKIIFNDAGLKDVEPPCVAQTFINHNAVLYKIFVIGKKHFVVPRPSIKNFSAGNYKTIHFDTQDVSKPDSCSLLNVLDEDDEAIGQQGVPDMAKMEHLIQGLQSQLGLDLFGVDVIIENNTGRYAVIDINAFPGYENGIDDLYTLLLNVFLDKLQHKAGDENHVTPDRSQCYPSSECRSLHARTCSITSGKTSDIESDEQLTQTPNITKSSETTEGDITNVHDKLSNFDLIRSLTDTNCNNNENADRGKSKEEQLRIINQRNFPNNSTVSQDTKPSIWDDLISKESGDSVEITNDSPN